MKKSTLFPAVLAAALLASSVTFAQQFPGGSSPGMSAALTKLFGTNTSFTAKSDVTVVDKEKKETMKVSMNFALLDGNMRAEIDMAQMKSKDLPPAAAEQLKQMGMDRVVSIVRMDKTPKSIYIIYPGLESYVKMPLPKDEAEAMDKEPKMEKTVLGKETIDGHPCVKNKVVITTEKGDKQEATVWNATDMKDFPVQIQTTEKGDTVLLRYKQVQLARPDAKLFDAPAAYKQYDDVQALMAGVMKKMLGGEDNK